MATNRRRSGRTRKANSKYSAHVTSLDLGSDDSEEIEVTIDEDPEDENFELDEKAVQDEGANGSDVESEQDGGVNSSAEDEDGGRTPEDISIAGSDEEQPAGRRPDSKKRIREEHARLDPWLSRSLPVFDRRTLYGSGVRGFERGIVDLPRRHARYERVRHTYGPDDEDLIPYIQNRNKWQDVVTLPSRKQAKNGSGGFSMSFYHNESMVQRESTQGWKWYLSDGGREAFANAQDSRPISEVEATSYFPSSSSGLQKFVMGPHKSQKIFSLSRASSLSLNDAWRVPSHEASESGQSSSKQSRRKGWVVNVGAKVQCLEWVSNNDSIDQYLAISTLSQEPHSRADHSAQKFKNTSAPAFTAAPPYSASMQIWHLKGSSESQNLGMTDLDCLPVLDTIVCFDWGDIKQFKWCPMPSPQNDSLSHTGGRRLGLLAGVWFDGAVRVLDIVIPPDSGSHPRYLHINEAAFTSRPPGTIPTCVTWLSTTSIAAGCADGNVAIWNLSAHLTSSVVTANAKPWFYRPFHSSYILSVTSCYPSRPHILITTSMDGFARETDLRAPNADFCLGQRSRVGVVPVAWHERSQSVLLIDETGLMRAQTLRRFFQAVETCKLGSQATDIATSPLHASVLTAQVDGTAVITAPMRKITDFRAITFRQTWFEYEWRQGLSEGQLSKLKNHDTGGQVALAEDADLNTAVDGVTTTSTSHPPTQLDHVDTMDVDHVVEHLQVVEAAEGVGRTGDSTSDAMDVDNTVEPEQSTTTTEDVPPAMLPPQAENLNLKEPLGRFLDGHKVERIEGPFNTSHLTIYEENAAITRVTWNPNPMYGGWAAAGTGSGLVRVEDVAL